MANLEYKAVAMPQLVAGRRRRGQASGELIAELVSKTINVQAERGWAYSGSESYRALEKRNWWSRSEEVIYTVLLFEREAAAAAARAEPEEAAPARSRPFEGAVERRAPRALGYEPEEEDDEYIAARRAAPRRRPFEDRDGFDDRDGFEDRDFDREDRAGYSDDDSPSGGRFGPSGGRLRRPR